MILDDILYFTKQDVRAAEENIPLKALKDMIRAQSPTRSLRRALQGPEIKIIAEIKRASPSAGMIREDINIGKQAAIYEKNGAAAISIVTEKHFFKGSLKMLGQARESTKLPILRKDFVIDPYQIFEARAFGADAVLLIARIVKRGKLAEFIKLAKRLRLTPLVEIHERRELDKALQAGATVIGINNRDLTTMAIDLDTTFNLASRIPGQKIVISESGVHTRQDMVKLKKSRVKAVLIGEALMRSTDAGRKLRELLGETGRKGNN